MASSSSRRRPQHADAGRAEHLVGGEGEEVAAELAHVGGQVGDRLGPVGQHQGAGARGRRRRCAAKGVIVPSTFDMAVQRDQLRAVEQAVEVGEVEAVVVVDGEPAQLDAALLGQHQPRDQVGVVLHLGEHDHVARGPGSPGPRCRRPG